MHVRVDADRRRAEAERHHQRRRLSSHALEVEQCVDGIGNLTAEFGFETTRDVANRARLGAIETDRKDRVLDASEIQTRESTRSGAIANRRADAASVTSSLVRRLKRVEMRMRNGSRSRRAISETDGSFSPATARRIAASVVATRGRGVVRLVVAMR